MGTDCGEPQRGRVRRDGVGEAASGVKKPTHRQDVVPTYSTNWFIAGKRTSVSFQVANQLRYNTQPN